jgi:hypothetical protein
MSRHARAAKFYAREALLQQACLTTPAAKAILIRTTYPLVYDK